MAILWKIGDPSFDLEMVDAAKDELCSGVSSQSDLESGLDAIVWRIDPDGHLVRAIRNGVVEWYKDAGRDYVVTLNVMLLDECSSSECSSSSSSSESLETCSFAQSNDDKVHKFTFKFDPDGHLSQASECGALYWYINDPKATPLTVIPFTFAFPALKSESEETQSSSSSVAGQCPRDYLPHITFRDLIITVDPDGHFLRIETAEKTKVTCGLVSNPCCGIMPFRLVATVSTQVLPDPNICGETDFILTFEGEDPVEKKGCWSGSSCVKAYGNFTLRLCCTCPEDKEGRDAFVMRFNNDLVTQSGPVECCPFLFVGFFQPTGRGDLACGDCPGQPPSIRIVVTEPT